MNKSYVKDKMSFDSLSDDELIHICNFLAVVDLGYLSLTCRSTYLCCLHEELWTNALIRHFPLSASYTDQPQSSFLSDGHYPKDSSRMKLKCFTKKNYTLTSLGELQKFRSRLLHRCATDQNGVSYIFGGTATFSNTNFGSFSDVWKVVVSENDQTVQFSRVMMSCPG